jgi:hypothetical protein
MLCSAAAAALFALPAFAQQPVVYGGGLRAKPTTTGAAVQRPVSTFATPYPTRPTPGPVRTVYDQPAPQSQQAVMPVTAQQAARPAANPPRPGGAAAPGAAGKVLYFHKSENATSPDGLADSSEVAQAAAQDTIPSIGVPDVSAAPPGVPQPVVVPNTVIEKPVVPPNFDPVLPSQPFIPVAPEATIPAFPEATRPVVQPEEKKPPEKSDPKKADSIKPVPPEVTQLPPRSAIFTIYGDDRLELLIRTATLEQVNKAPNQPQKKLEDMAPFPTLKPTVAPGTKYVAKTETMPPRHVTYEPGFIIHRHLHFEERNSERYGWDLGLATPFISTMAFYKDVLLLPSKLGSSLVVGKLDTNAGKCLPGSPTPYYLYPPGLTITGTAAEGLVVTGLAFVIP